ncbi:MAG: rod shape-determining protein MreC [Myxococcales bacterium]|nr:rod shape-determining protein MreC [Myxococcales bacterium]
MSELVTRFRYALCYLVLLAVSVVSMTSEREPIGTGPASALVLGVATPLQRLVTRPIDFVRWVWRDYLALVDVRSENLELRVIIARLQNENLSYREALVASERFQRLADFRARHDAPMVPANVVAQDLSPWFRSVVIDRGAEAGIEAGMPVINEHGVVGRVVGVTGSASKVLLVVDMQSRIDAFVQRSRARGIVRGQSSRECAFDYVMRNDDVRPGDLLLTSGLDAIFPKGLVVGTVETMEREPYGLFQRAQIQPVVDFRDLEEVFVILERREAPAAPGFEAAQAPVTLADAGDTP